jgi:phage N-6-adenine-methyltransferase
MAPPPQKPHRSKQDYCTPRPFLHAVERRLGITAWAFDIAADETNHVGDAQHYWSEQEDALHRDWLSLPRKGWSWLNPPFADIRPWAYRCALYGNAPRKIALLVPASVGSDWYRDYVDRRALVLALNGRLAFMPDQPRWLYPKDCVLALYGVTPGFEVWNWREEG